MATHLCIGGPLHGQAVEEDDVRGKGYVQYNCASSRNRTRLAVRRAAARGEVLPPSMIWLHNSWFSVIKEGT